MQEYHIKKYKNGLYRVYKMPIQYKNFNKSIKNINDSKIIQSISRAKNTIIDYCLSNDFVYFITITISNEYDRFNIKGFIDKFNEIIKYYREVKHQSFDYIIIPEKHKNGAYHIHGFLNGINPAMIYLNDNGFYSCYYFDRLGFNSISKIKNYEASIFYLLKYIGKGFADVEKGQHLYYHSRGLNKSRSIIKFYGSDNLPIHYDFINNFNAIKTLNYSQIKAFLKSVKDNDKIYYGF